MFKNKNLDYNKIILSMTFLLPFMDIYRALIGNRFEILGISLVELFNFIFSTILFILMLMKNNKENKKVFSKKMIPIIIIYIMFIVFHLAHILTLKSIIFLNSDFSIFVEIYYIIKGYILPLIILLTYMKSELNSNDIIETLSKVSFIFSIIIVITNILGVSLVAYSSNYEGIVQIKDNIFSWFKGIDLDSIDLYTSRGLFYSTNQISATLGALLFVSVFYTLKKDNVIYYISFFVKILAAIMLSTKTAFIAIICSILSIYIYNAIIYILYRKNELTKKSFLFLLQLIIIIVIFNCSPVKYKLKGYVSNLNDQDSVEIIETAEVSKVCVDDYEAYLANKSNLSINKIMKKKEIDEIEKKYITSYLSNCPATFNVHEDYIKFYPVNTNFNFWFKTIHQPISKLTNYRNLKKSIYHDFLSKHNDYKDKLVGIGYTSNFPYLEVDFVGQYLWFGLFGVIIFIIPYIMLIVKNIFKFLLNFERNFKSSTVSLALACVFMVLASIMAGHVFGIILPSTILALLITGLNEELKINVITDNKKITFLLLHLGYGGIETSTINTANALCDKYDIEIISFYKLSYNQSNKINKKVKVRYLYNGGPNREEFKKYLKEHRYIMTFIEGIKAVNILIRKKLLVIRAIIDSDSKYIVSTRWEFSILLSRYGNKNSIKIAQEHHYHNNNQKYIKVISNKYNNIDYLCALTKTLEEDYKKFLINNKHTKVILLPNMITEIPKVNSSLKEKNIITVSRLDYGKRNDEIIKSFSKIEENDWKLYIIGDGKEFNNLSNLVKELRLEDRVILTGYKDKKEIEKYMLKSSIFLMASVSEGLPMVLLEAMSYGIPCIAYETDSGTSDIIEDCKNGYIIKNRNEEEYIERIETLIQNEGTRKEFGKYAKQSVNKFSKEEITKIWEKILNSGE